MLKCSKITAFALLAALASGQGYAQENPAVPATTKVYPGAVVNGVTISEEVVNERVNEAEAQGQRDSPALRAAIRDELISIELIVQAAVKKGMGQSAAIMRQIDTAKQTVLINAYVQDHFKHHPVGEDVLKQEYEYLKISTGDKEYNARHILVLEESEAKSIIVKLKKGAKFAQLASQHSLDSSSGKKGGALGWNRASSFVKPFADALATLEKGVLSAPVKSDFGWHIIKLDDVRDLKFPPYQEVRENLLRRFQQQAVQKLVADLRDAAKIELPE